MESGSASCWRPPAAAAGSNKSQPKWDQHDQQDQLAAGWPGWVDQAGQQAQDHRQQVDRSQPQEVGRQQVKAAHLLISTEHPEWVFWSS